MKYNLAHPCPQCPFRNDIKPFITPERADEIASTDGEFPCHKTTVLGDENDEEGDMVVTPESQHCAGFLILREKMEQPSQMMRICERLGLYDRSKLDMAAPVYDDLDEMLDAHEIEQ